MCLGWWRRGNWEGGITAIEASFPDANVNPSSVLLVAFHYWRSTLAGSSTRRVIRLSGEVSEVSEFGQSKVGRLRLREVYEYRVLVQ